MIRINLLPHRELARAARRRQFNILLGIAVVAGVLAVVLGHSVIAARQSARTWSTRSGLWMTGSKP